MSSSPDPKSAVRISRAEFFQKHLEKHLDKFNFNPDKASSLEVWHSQSGPKKLWRIPREEVVEDADIERWFNREGEQKFHFRISSLPHRLISVPVEDSTISGLRLL
jgi:hypothetical protein